MKSAADGSVLPPAYAPLRDMIGDFEVLGRLGAGGVGTVAVKLSQTSRASSGGELNRLLKENDRNIFSLIHKFNQAVAPHEPDSTRDDISVVSGEARRAQTGKLAR